MDLALTKEDAQKKELKRRQDYEDSEMQGVTKGLDGKQQVDLDYAPIAPEMPTVKEEDIKWTKKVSNWFYEKDTTKKSTKAERRSGQPSMRHFGSSTRKKLSQVDSSQEVAGGLGKISQLDRKYSASDTARLWAKDELLRSADFEDQFVDHTAKFQEILNQLRDYAKRDYAGMDENQLLNKNAFELQRLEMYELSRLMELLDNWRIARPGDDEIHKRERGLAEAYYQRLQPLMQGSLEVGKDGIHLDRTKANTFLYENGGKLKKTAMYDMADQPIFAHEPSVNDIRQGGLGDCYLVSSLSSLAENEPGTIKNMIRDNGNGTATVRFYSVVKKEEGDQSPTPEKIQTAENSDYNFTPFYVTVKKQTPTASFALGSFWVDLIEQAYAASGLPTEYKKKALEMSPKDKKANDAINYNDIVGGDPGLVLMQLTGRPVETMDNYGTQDEMIAKMQDLISFETLDASRNVDADTRRGVFKAEEWANQEGGLGEKVTKNLDIAYVADKIFDKNAFKIPDYIKYKDKYNPFYDPNVISMMAYAQHLWLRNFKHSVAEQSYKEKDKETGKEKNKYLRMATYEDYLTEVNKLTPDKLDDIEAMKDQLKDGVDITKFFTDAKTEFISLLRNAITHKKEQFALEKLDEKSFGINNYEGSPTRMFFQIEEWLSKKKTVEAATQSNSYFGKLEDRMKMKADPEKNGELVGKGIAGGHAYSVLGTQLRGDRCYVKLRNPWGSTIREYTMDTNKEIERHEVKDLSTCGIFLIEINDFAANFEQIYAV